MKNNYLTTRKNEKRTCKSIFWSVWVFALMMLPFTGISQQLKSNHDAVKQITAEDYAAIRASQQIVRSSQNATSTQVDFGVNTRQTQTQELDTRSIMPCTSLDTKWLTPTSTPSIFNFGMDDYVTGTPAPTLNGGPGVFPIGFYESYVTPTPGTSVVGAVEIGIGGLDDLNDNMTFNVVVYEADAAGTPIGGPIDGVAGISPTLLGVPTGLSFGIFTFEVSSPAITSTNFLIGVEIFPGEETDGLIVVSTADLEGEAAGENFTSTNGFGYLNYLAAVGIDFDLYLIPTMGEFAAFGYDSAAYSDCTVTNPTPTIIGAAGGTFSSAPAGLVLNTSTGEIDPAASTVGSYTVSYVTPAGCAAFTDQTVEIVTPTTTTFTMVSGWDNGAPTSNSFAVINDDYSTSAGNITACTCEISSDATVTVGSGEYIDVAGDITVNGTLNVEHQGTVIQEDPSASVIRNAGAMINVELSTPPLKERDFMLMGSPMDAETRTGVFNSAFLVLEHIPSNFIPHPMVPAGGTNFADDNGDFLSQMAGGPINVGEGYLVRPQAGYDDPAYDGPPPVSTIVFDMTYTEGTLNNGDVMQNVEFNATGNPDGTPNLLSNPYASAIDAELLINDLDNTVLNEIYFWEHLTPPSTAFPGANPGINFSMDDLSIFNGMIGLPAANDPGTSTASNGVISTGQGFAIKAFAAGSVTFKNSMRLQSGNSTLRSSNSLDKIMLKVSNAEYELGSYTGIVFSELGTDGLDQKFDSNRLATSISLYSHLEDGSEQLGIQTRESFDSSIKIPVGFASQVAKETTYAISIVSIEGSNLGNTTVYLYDTQEQVLTNLSQGDYEFQSNKGTFNTRFTILFDGEVLDVQDTAISTIAIFPNPTRDVLTIVSPNAQIERVSIVDLQGRTVLQGAIKATNQHQLDLNHLDTSVYLVTVTTEAGTITKRIIKQ